MLTALALGLLLHSQTPTITRDSYGVAQINAEDQHKAFRQMGYAVAQDRLWQMEKSRRLAEGRMAEFFGPKFVSSDREVLTSRYTDEELQKQLIACSPDVQDAFAAYAQGVNDYVTDATQASALPPGYAENGFKPEQWTPLDSIAISVRLFQLFGRQGGGELRDWALYKYLEAQPKIKGKTLDVFNDVVWQNVDDSPTTLAREDDAQLNTHPAFPVPTTAITQKHLARLPKASLFDLLPGLSVAEREVSGKVAMNESVPYKTGSYAIVVSGRRSATGHPLLLSGPQMGLSVPSIGHEIRIITPEFDVAGLDVPGVPAVLVGNTPNLAWALTTGVADCDDFYFLPGDEKGVRYNGMPDGVDQLPFDIKVKGGDTQHVTQLRTRYGPVLLKAAGQLFSRRSATFMHEMTSLNCLFGMYRGLTATDIENSSRSITMNMNLFYATKKGDIGWVYTGLVPQRQPGWDPRLPLPGAPETEWNGAIPWEQMPHVRNPKSGLLSNWNNKPAAWWPNLDTPAWGEIFRVSVLRQRLQKPRLNESDLELAIWAAARTDERWTAFAPFAQKLANADILSNYDGLKLDSSPGQAAFRAWYNALRVELFTPNVGSLVTQDLFDAAIQPSLTVRTLQGKTNFDYARGEKLNTVLEASWIRAKQKLTDQFGPDPASWRAPVDFTFAGGEATRIPYGNRGTFIQIVSLGDTVFARSVLPPGVAESGPHAYDQSPLAREWMYKVLRPVEKKQ